MRNGVITLKLDILMVWVVRFWFCKYQIKSDIMQIETVLCSWDSTGLLNLYVLDQMYW